MKDRRKAEQMANALAQSCRSKQQQARLWLVLFLANGSQRPETVLTHGQFMGFSITTIKRASRGVITHLHDPIFGGQWRWKLLEPIQTKGLSVVREWTTDRLLELME